MDQGGMGGGFRRPMNDVSALGLTCSECGTPIKELPFQPTKRDDGTYGRLYCYDCNKNRRARTGGDRFRR